MQNSNFGTADSTPSVGSRPIKFLIWARLVIFSIS